MEYELLINGENIKMTIPSVAASGVEEAMIGDKKYAFSGRALSGNELLLRVAGQQMLVYVADSGGETQIFMNGKSYLIEDVGDADRRAKRKGGPGDREDAITPPMPAMVIRLLVAVGDKVKKKQPLIVLSAMKMETTLGAPYDGVVAKVNAVAGEQVMPGLILVEIERAPEDENGN
jgi:3-methylcrotonyl-CoA carboxylase alpha subunit